MSKNHPPSPAASPPPLPGNDAAPQHAQVNNQRPVPPARIPKKRNSLACLWVLLLLMGGAGYWVWQRSIAQQQAMHGFQPPEMAMARYTPKDVIGDLGGLKVRIPRHYAEYVEYDGDPGFGEKRKGPVPERTVDSKLRSFGVKVRFPDMKGLETRNLREEYRSYHLNPDNPWVDVGIDSGENYPGLGVNALDGLAKGLGKHNDYWLDNYEKLPEKRYGLDVYVLRGVSPKTGLPAREDDAADDIYINREASGRVDTYIRCGRTSVPGGISRCHLKFGLEPEAEVFVNVAIYPKLLPQWKEIKQSVKDLLLNFEVQNITTNKP